jgi:hypothetical protein
MNVLIPGLTSVLGLVFAVALFDQWRERRGGFQLIWGIGMLFYGVAAGCEAIGEAAGWNGGLFRGWFAFGVATPAWLGLGSAFLLARTRFGYTYATVVLLSAVLAFVVRGRYSDAGLVPVSVLFGGVIFALAIGLETYFQNERWPVIAAIAVGVTTGVMFALAAVLPLNGSLALGTSPTLTEATQIMPGAIRILAFPLTIPGGLALLFGAVFSTYVFMPKRRVLPYSLDPNQPSDQFLFNLFIAPVAILVNLVASLPGAGRALLTGRIHSRVPATILIALGAFVPNYTDSLDQWAALGRFVGVVLLFVGFLVSIEVFREIRIPFTSIRFATARRERVPAPPDGSAGSEAVESTTGRAARQPTD